MPRLLPSPAPRQFRPIAFPQAGGEGVVSEVDKRQSRAKLKSDARVREGWRWSARPTRAGGNGSSNRLGIVKPVGW
jgi:hypothetical protein